MGMFSGPVYRIEATAISVTERSRLVAIRQTLIDCGSCSPPKPFPWRQFLMWTWFTNWLHPHMCTGSQEALYLGFLGFRRHSLPLASSTALIFAPPSSVHISRNNGFTIRLRTMRRAGIAAALPAIVGAINIPIIHFSVVWWNSLHRAT